jgi:protein phosphatase
LHCAIATDIGLLREENQDIVRAEEFGPNVLAVVCDGMGGESSGLEASEKTISVFFERFNSGYKERARDEEIKHLLLSSISAANSVVYSLSRMNFSNEGMGTTCVAAYVTPKKLYIVNAGDSRAYYYSKGDLLLLTHDHTAVNELIRLGEMTEAEAARHPSKHMLTRAVGIDKMIDADYFTMNRERGSRILLCSDGLSGYCDAFSICEILSRRLSTEKTVKKLMHLALDKGGRDNISVAVIDD